jgi:hypothetical protein
MGVIFLKMGDPSVTSLTASKFIVIFYRRGAVETLDRPATGRYPKK